MDIIDFKKSLAEVIYLSKSRRSRLGDAWMPFDPLNELFRVILDSIYEQIINLSHEDRLAEVIKVRKDRQSILKGISLKEVDSNYPGELLLFDFDATLSDGVAKIMSQDFLTKDNIPSMVYWVAYIKEDNVRALPEINDLYNFHALGGSYLISWIPADRVEQVTEAISAIPDNSLAWANDITSPFLDELRVSGLLREPTERFLKKEEE